MTDDLKLGLSLQYWQKQPEDATDTVLAAERLGYDSIWMGEAYGSDALTPLTWYAARTSRIKLGSAIVQIDARTPANTAMAAMTLDALSGGRFSLGLGVSGPQIVEGWYGRPFPKPLARTREYIEILRMIWAREGNVEYDGEFYQLPLRGGTGLGKPLHLITEPVRRRIPIYLGAQGPKNTEMAVELADGWLPAFVHIEQFDAMYGDVLANQRPDFGIAATVNCFVDDDLEGAFRRAKEPLAFYVGGMGAKGKNFHFDAVARAGYGDVARKVQDLFLANRRSEAVEAIPDELVDGTSLIGPPERIRERLKLWRDSPVNTILLAGVRDEPTLRALRDAAEL
jgi:F420-dependent oxidoreductase-like protein